MTTTEPKPKVRTAAELNIELKKIQIEKNANALMLQKTELVYRSAVERMLVRNGAKVRNIFISLANRIRQELKLSLDQRDEIDKVIDAVMSENLHGTDDDGSDDWLQGKR
jgi:transcriptional regulator